MSICVRPLARYAIVAAVLQAMSAVPSAASGDERAAVVPVIDTSKSPRPAASVNPEIPDGITAPASQKSAPPSDFVRNPFDSGMGIRLHRYGRSTRVFGTH